MSLSPVRLALAFGYGPEVRRKPFGFHLAMDTLPSPCTLTRSRRDMPGLLSTHPPCEGAAGLSPVSETPCWAQGRSRCFPMKVFNAVRAEEPEGKAELWHRLLGAALGALRHPGVAYR